MSPRRRELILKVCDGDSRVLPALHMCTQFYRCDEMVEWLLKHKITGHNLWDWIKESHGGSYFSMAKFVLTRVKREAVLQPVIAGRDFITLPGRTAS